MTDPSRLVPVGKVLKPQGLKGEVKVAVSDVRPEALCEGHTLTLKQEGELKTVEIERAWDNGRFAFLKFKGVDSIEQAESLRNSAVLIPEAEYRDLAGDLLEKRSHIGMTVFDNRDGRKMGRVVDIEEYPTCDTLVIERAEQETLLIPMVPGVLLSVDKEAGRIMIDGAQLNDLL